MKKYDLTRRQVSELLGISCKKVEIWRTPTCDAWLAKPGSSNYNDMPDHRLELLRLKLGDK